MELVHTMDVVFPKQIPVKIHGFCNNFIFANSRVIGPWEGTPRISTICHMRRFRLTKTKTLFSGALFADNGKRQSQNSFYSPFHQIA